jgi:DNA (cytosine-5)-methyltransferase 1
MAVATRPSSRSVHLSTSPLSSFDESRALHHSSFLRRNGSALAAMLSTEFELRPSRLPFSKKLLIFVAAQRPAELLDGRVLRGLLRAFSAENLRRKDLPFWIRRLSASVGIDAPRRISRLLGIVSTRDDFPALTSMTKWGLSSWEGLFSRLEIDEREARTFVSLVLGRRGYLPAGQSYECLYRRLGVKIDQRGVPIHGSFTSAHRDHLAWQLAALALHRCTAEIEPGGPTCRECPALRFCQEARNKQFPKSEGPEFIDVFAGGGGMSLGFCLAGFRERAAVELDINAADTLYFNHPELGRHGILVCDAEQLAADPWFLKENKGVPVLVGGPPCQPYSIAHRHNHPDEKDERRFLFRPFLQMARALQVRLVIMENVPGIRTAAKGETLPSVEEEFNRGGFEIDHRVLDAAEYGVPQHRKRVFFIGVNRAFYKDPSTVIASFWSALESMKAMKPATVGQALSGIPRIAAGEGGMVVRRKQGNHTSLGRTLRGGAKFAYNHEARPHNSRDIRIFKLLKQGEPAWRLEARMPGTIPYQMESFGDKFRKLHLNEPSPTIPAHLSRDANSFVHPIVPRGITCREAARLQSFPDDYVFLGGFGHSFKQTGNAVPPLLAKAVAKAVLAVMNAASPAQSV